MEKNESVKKLEVGKDYVHLSDSNLIVIDRGGNANNNGFVGERFYKTLNCATDPYWREATEEEVIEAFRKHLGHRYGEDWETMKIKERHPDSSLPINRSLWSVEVSKEYDGWNVWNRNGLLYCNGIWVERLEEKEEEPKIHIKEAIKENTVIHCETEEEAKRVSGMAHELGYRWWNGKKYEADDTEWNVYKSTMCYYLFDGSYSDCDYFKNRNYTIIHSTQIADLKPEELDGWSLAPEEIEEKSDKKRYEVIKTTFSDFKQLSLGDNKTNKVIAHFVNQDEDTLLLAENIAGILNLIDEINQMNDGSIMEIYKVKGGFKTKFQSGWVPAPTDDFCHKCGGIMKFTGISKLSLPAQNEYMCEKCKHVQYIIEKII